MEKLFFYDVETTGLDYKKNAVHQLSAIIVIDGQEKERLDIKIRPFDGAEISQEALDVANVTKEQIMTYQPLGDAHKQLIEILSKYVNKYDKTDKFYLVGYNNAHFDNDFLREMFTRCGDKYFGSWFWPNSIDTMTMATIKLMKQRQLMPNFKLATVARQLNIPLEETKLHDALYDVELTRHVFNETL